MLVNMFGLTVKSARSARRVDIYKSVSKSTSISAGNMKISKKDKNIFNWPIMSFIIAKQPKSTFAHMNPILSSISQKLGFPRIRGASPALLTRGLLVVSQHVKLCSVEL